MDNETRVVPMNVVGSDAFAMPGRFVFTLQSHADNARTVNFSIDGVDARALYEALGKFLQQ
jgi:hypothetical protein